jgi:hypothetical protein
LQDNGLLEMGRKRWNVMIRCQALKEFSIEAKLGLAVKARGKMLLHLLALLAGQSAIQVWREKALYIFTRHDDYLS